MYFTLLHRSLRKEQVNFYFNKISVLLIIILLLIYNATDAVGKTITDYNDSAYTLITKANSGKEDYEQALEVIKKAQELDPFDFETCLLTGIIYYKLGKSPEAEYWLECAERKNPVEEMAKLNSVKNAKEKLKRKVEVAVEIAGRRKAQAELMTLQILASEGFRGLKWGEELHKVPDMLFQMEFAKGKSKQYVKEKESFREFEVDFDRIEYYTWGDKFFKFNFCLMDTINF